jgi:5-methylthioadenosine/S-adenosylhomocysteine deaminase
MTVFSRSALIAASVTVVAVSAIFFFKARPVTPGARFVADVVIEHGLVLTMDDSSRIIEDGWVQIKDGVIVAMGSGEAPAGSKQSIDAHGKTILPGLINTHTHVGATVLRDIENSSQLREWLTIIERYEQKMAPEDVYWSSMLGISEMVRTGTTTFNDMYFQPEQTVQAASEMGVRAIVRIPTTREHDTLVVDSEFIKHYQHNSLLSFSIAPNPLLAYSSDDLNVLKSLLGDVPYLVHVHIASDLEELQESQEKWHKSPLQVMIDSGLLDHPTILAHATYLNEDDVKQLRNYPKAGISLTPKSEYKLNHGQSANLEQILDAGVTVALGTDGAASSTGLDMFGEMNFLATAMSSCSSKAQYCENKNNVSPEQILRMATSSAAKLLGLDSQIGSIEVGKRADIIIVDTNQSKFVPSTNPYSRLVYYAHGSDVTDALVNGKIIMQARQFIKIDEPEIYRHLLEIRKKITQ